ncbi:hypothetical protein [Nonomuraea sp. NPDC050310]|uniref:TetR/AcrR family transcriptional regulator n=1 Tax=Nonomuraea sp. NPDC050310 TaxID=3154935 RepID=UPI0033CBF8FD
MGTVSACDTDRKTRLADAAIRIVGDEGLRSLTHRAADAAAGLPPGTCSYHFGTRSELLTAVLHRIATLDQADFDAALGGRQLSEMDIDEVVDGAVTVLTLWLGPARTRSRARLLLSLDPQVRQLAEPTVQTLATMFQHLAVQLTGDAGTARLLMAFVDGLVLDELIRADAPADAERLRFAIHALATTVIPVAPPS